MNELTEKFDKRRRALREEDTTPVVILGIIHDLLDEVERLRTHVDELQREITPLEALERKLGGSMPYYGCSH